MVTPFFVLFLACFQPCFFSFVAAVDLYKTFNEIGNRTYEYLIPYTAMAVIYIVLVAIISLAIKLMERSLRKSDRRN